MKFPGRTSAMINISAVTGCGQPTRIFAYLILRGSNAATCLIFLYAVRKFILERLIISNIRVHSKHDEIVSGLQLNSDWSV